MNPQDFVDRHSDLFATFFPIFFFCLWLTVSGIISFIGGWYSLSRCYRNEVPFSGAKWRMQSGQMRWRANYNNALTIGANEEGLYLGMIFLFRFMHPPLLIPWNEVRVRRTSGWLFDYVILTLGQELAIPLRIRAGLGNKLREIAASRWPIEET